MSSLENDVIISAITNLQGQIGEVGKRVDQAVAGIGEVKAEVAAQGVVLENVHREVRRTNGRVTELEDRHVRDDIKQATAKAFHEGERSVQLRWVSRGKGWLFAGRWLWATGLALVGALAGYFGRTA